MNAKVQDLFILEMKKIGTLCNAIAFLPMKILQKWFGVTNKMMSRKDYVRVAQILESNRNDIDEDTFSTLIEQFCDLFFEDNHNFSPMRFEEACYGK